MSDDFDPDLFAKKELDTWDRCANSYLDTWAGLMNETTPPVVAAGAISAGSRVLELGSGPGNTANILAQSGASVTAIDFSSKMVEVARSAYPEITFKQADAEQLPFEADSFDAVVASFLLHRLARPEVVLREAFRVLKPTGRFAFALFGEAEDQSSVMAFFEAVEAHHEFGKAVLPPLYGVTERSVFEPMLLGAGLIDCKLDVHEIRWRTDSLDPVIRGFWDYANITELPSKVQKNIVETLTEKTQAFKHDNGFDFPHTALVGSAMKPQRS